MREHLLQKEIKEVLRKAEVYTQTDNRTLVTVRDVARALYEDDADVSIERSSGLLPLGISQELGEILELTCKREPWLPNGVIEAACLLFSFEARSFAREKLGGPEFEKRYLTTIGTYLGEELFERLLTRFEIGNQKLETRIHES